MKIRCHNCHNEIDSVIMDYFDHNGKDKPVRCKLELSRDDNEDPVAEVETDANWCGSDMDDEERFNYIHCPKCGEFPFGIKVLSVWESTGIAMFPSDDDIVFPNSTKGNKMQNNTKKKTNPAKSDGFSNRQTITHEHVQVPKAIADRIAKSSGGTVVLENNTEAYNVGDLIGFDVVTDIIGSLDTLHEICGNEGRLYEVTYVYSGRGIEPGYVLVQFRESDKNADGK